MHNAIVSGSIKWSDDGVLNSLFMSASGEFALELGYYLYLITCTLPSRESRLLHNSFSHFPISHARSSVVFENNCFCSNGRPHSTAQHSLYEFLAVADDWRFASLVWELPPTCQGDA
jgi:hypothetical protein